MRIKITICLVFYFTIQLSIIGQNLSVSGLVYDEESNNNISYAKVTAINGSSKHSTVDGDFLIQVPKNNSIQYLMFEHSLYCLKIHPILVDNPSANKLRRIALRSIRLFSIRNNVLSNGPFTLSFRIQNSINFSKNLINDKDTKIGISGFPDWYPILSNGEFKLEISKQLFYDLPEKILAIIRNPIAEDQIFEFSKMKDGNIDPISLNINLKNKDILDSLSSSNISIMTERNTLKKKYNELDSLFKQSLLNNSSQKSTINNFIMSNVIDSIRIDTLKKAPATTYFESLNNKLFNPIKSQGLAIERIERDLPKKIFDPLTEARIINGISRRVSFLNLDVKLGLTFPELVKLNRLENPKKFPPMGIAIWILNKNMVYDSINLSLNRLDFDSRLVFGYRFAKGEINFGWEFSSKTHKDSITNSLGFRYEGLIKRNDSTQFIKEISYQALGVYFSHFKVHKSLSLKLSCFATYSPINSFIQFESYQKIRNEIKKLTTDCIIASGDAMFTYNKLSLISLKVSVGRFIFIENDNFDDEKMQNKKFLLNSGSVTVYVNLKKDSRLN